MNYKLWFWIVNIVSTALRFLIIGKIGLTIDEAHYWVYTKFLDFSYFGHPPFIAYLIKASTLIFGNNEFAVRFPTVLIFFFVCWIFFICAKKLYNERTAFIGVLLLNILPVFSFLGSIITVPDSPLALFWISASLIFIILIETNNKNYWYLIGIITGLAMLSKYNGILIPFSIFMFLILSPTHRFWFKRKEPYFALIISILMFLPVIIWNIENNWASFGFQLNHGFGNSMPKFSFAFLIRAIGAQAGYVSPLLFLVFIIAVFLCVKEVCQRKDRTPLIIACFSLPVLLLFNTIATFNEILPHWTAMGYLILSIYVAHLTLKFWHIKGFRVYSYVAWGLALFMIILALLHVFYRIVPIEKFLQQEQIEKIRHGIPEPERIDITNEVYGWKEVGNEIKRILNSYPPKERPFIFTYKSYLASQLAASVPKLRVFCISDKFNAYDIWQKNLIPLKHKNGLFICNDYFFSDPKERYGNKAFTSYTDIEEFPVYRNGRKIKNFFFTLCKSFDSSQLPEDYTKNVLGQKKNLLHELLKLDYNVFKFINSDLKCKFLDFCMSIQSYCDYKEFNLGFIVMLIISIAILWINKKERFWTTLALLISSLAITAIIVYFLKHYFERSRPLAIFGDANVNILFEKVHRNSFPSGHTQLAFTICAFMFIMVRKYWYWYIILACVTSFERIYAGSHFPSDVIAGAIMGILSAYMIVTLFKKYS
ncbi:MAG: glycosyltransferase family 39 protein [Endomicrobium sp.]|jgi:4-amino-4-deoxy-L-arabinose transferase-like glycosyltransferase|nr:glycosyltransferase family 39 protein [Endomicrobium sp.]